MKQGQDDVRCAIMQVIEEEGDAFLRRDYGGWARCWVHEPYIKRWAYSAARGVYAWVGWDEHSARMKSFMAAHPEPSPAVYRREDVDIRAGHDLAWVTFDQYTSGALGPLIDLPELSAEMRVMERCTDGWKFAFICNFHHSLDHVSWPLVRVDERAAMMWANPAAQEVLSDRRGIVVRGGRVHATDRTADQRLQAAIVWASQRDDGIWPRRGTLPIVLDGGRGDAANVCWVIAQNTQILISINNRDLTEERLAAAASVYGITPAQLRLAGLIIAGYDLVASARRLGISANTARTHLLRMFDKTGVRTQPALVRVLLSVASPLV